MSACPDREAALKVEAAAAAREAKLKAENALLVQQLAAAKSVTALSANVNPYGVFGPYSVYGAGATAPVATAPVAAVPTPSQAGQE